MCGSLSRGGLGALSVVYGQALRRKMTTDTEAGPLSGREYVFVLERHWWKVDRWHLTL